MANDHTPQQQDSTQPDAADERKQLQQQARAASYAASSKKGSYKASKSHKPPIGGTAVPGAKSTLPKPQLSEISNPNEQQIASSNRDMRRRMQNMGTGPYAENQTAQKAQSKRKERIERRKQRLDEQRARLRKSLPGGVAIGRRNTYFLIAVVALVVLLIVVFAVLRATHVI